MNERITEIENENRKKMKIFFIILLAAVVFGIIIGLFGAMNIEDLNEGYGYFEEYTLPVICVFAMFAVIVISHLIIWTVYFKAKKTYPTISDEDEDRFESLSKRIGFAIWFSTLSFIICDGLWGVVAGQIFFGMLNFGLIGASIICFLINIFLVLIEQQKLVDLLKQMNPDKNVSIYDMRFTEKWYDSCDEAEKMTIAKSAWYSYKWMEKVYAVAWMISLLANMYLSTGSFACILVTVLWALHITFYWVAGKKM